MRPGGEQRKSLIHRYLHQSTRDKNPPAFGAQLRVLPALAIAAGASIVNHCSLLIYARRAASGPSNQVAATAVDGDPPNKVSP